MIRYRVIKLPAGSTPVAASAPPAPVPAAESSPSILSEAPAGSAAAPETPVEAAAQAPDAVGESGDAELVSA